MGYSIDKEVLFIFGIPIYIVISGIILFLKRKKGKDISIFRELVKFSFAVYIFALIGVTLFPIEINLGDELKRNYGVPINYIPFRSIAEDIAQLGNGYFSTGFQIKLLLRNVGGNFVLLMPLAVFIPILWKKIDSFKRVSVLCFMVSLTIELLQLLEGTLNLALLRIVDIDDLILNTLGAIFGYVIYMLFCSVFLKINRKENK